MIKYFVSPNNSGACDGSENAPFSSIFNALNAVKNLKKKDDVILELLNGYYYLDKPLKITPEITDKTSSLTIRAENEGEAIISGGRRVENWEEVSLNGLYMYRAKLDNVDSVRVFTVNGVTREIASLFKEKKQRKGWGFIPGTNYSTFEVRFATVPEIHNPKQLEAVWISEWKMFCFRAEKVSGNNITMKEPYFSRITSIIKLAGSQTEHDINGYWWPNPARHPVFLQNDISFLTKRGEFCFDELGGYIYYYPFIGEDISEVVCHIGELDEIIGIDGEDSGEVKRVKNVTFEGVVIENGDFSMIAKEGLGVNQAQSYYAGIATLNAQNRIDIPYNQYTSNINVNFAENINFKKCTVRNTGRGGVYFHDGVYGGSVEGCVFQNIGDSSVIVGDGMHGHCKDSHMTRDITIANNLVRTTSRVVFSAPGIQAYFVKNLKVVHNDVYDVGYGGLTIGWGWTVCLDSHITENTLLEGNRVGNYANRVRDCGGIYTLGQSPNSVCRYNYIYEQMEAFGALYHDEGSAGYDTYKNVVNSNTCLEDREMTWLWMNGFLNGPNGILSVYNISVHDNYHNNKREESARIHTPSSRVYDNIYVEGDNFPFEALKIINDSGLNKEYKYIFSKLI